jgi:hypothetical protein
VPKKRAPRQRRQTDERARAEQRRLARQELEREEHARLVVERAGDPRFVQRVTTPDGGAAPTWDPESADGQALRQAMQANAQAFREKFGRDPGPDDPVFFDPGADKPVPLTGQAWDDGFADMAQAAAEAGVDPAYIAAWHEVGYIVTDANRHLFSAADVQAYLDAVARHQHDDEDEDDEDEGEWWDPAGEAADGLREVVAEVLATGDSAAGRRLVAALEHTDDGEAAGLAASTLVAVLLGWLAGAREQLGSPAAAPVIAWVGEQLGPDVAGKAMILAGVLGHPLAPDLTVEEAFDRVGAGLVELLLWLVCGLVATAGDADVNWLVQFDPDTDDA